MARKLLIPALLLGALLALPGAANAASPDVCVWDQNVSPAPASCGDTYNMNRAGLVVALAVADGVFAFQGETTLRIGPGTLSLDSAVTIAPSPGEQLNIVGSGSGAGGTVLAQDPTLLGAAINFWPTFVTDSSISNLAVNVSGATNPYLGMIARGGRLNNVSFRVLADTESYHAGLQLEGLTPTVVSDSSFTIVGPGQETLGVRVRNNSTITRSRFSVEGVFHPGQVGVAVEGTNGDGVPGAKITRSSFVGFDSTISQFDGLLYVQDVLIDLLSEDSASGISVRDQINGSAPLDFRGEGLTIVGVGNNQEGLAVDTTSGDDGAAVSVSGMIGVQTGLGSRELSCGDAAGSAATLNLAFNLFALANYLPGSAAGGCALTLNSNLDRATTPPKFVSPGDYRPTVDSPAVDAGNDDADRNPPKLDLAGNPRFVDANGDGIPRIDIGAYEFQLPPPTADTSIPDNPSLRWRKPVGRFVILKKPKAFSLTTAKKRPRYPINLDRAGTVKLSLKLANGGWQGVGCRKTKPKRKPFKRCDLPLRGSQRFMLPAGDSYFTFGGRWNKRTLAPGKYKLTADNQGFAPAVTALTLKKRR